MYATGMIRKLDNGYRGAFVNESERGLWKVGDELFNRQLHPFPKGSLVRVRIFFSPKGRKMVKEVTLVESAASFLEEIGEVEVSKPTLEEFVEKMIEPEPEPEEVAPVRVAAGNGYYVGNQERLVFNTALGMSLRNPERAVKVMMVGPSGYGKTSLPKLFAEVSGKRYLRMNCATVRDPEEWFGFREAQEGSTVFIRSAFAKALEAGNLVVVLDEFNRLEPWLHNTLFPLLDDDGATVVHDQQFRIGSGVIVVGTINTGYKYTGTFELDEALMNRFEFILEVGPMPFDNEVDVLTQRTGINRAVAKDIVKVANILRQNDVVCSTRTTLLIANMVVSGLYVREAFETAVVKRIPIDSSGSALRKQVIDLINVELGPVEERNLGADIFSFGGEVEEKVEVKRHKVTLFVEDGSKIQMLRLIQLVSRLDVIGPKLSIGKISNLCHEMVDGETIILELKGDPGNLSGFTELGVSVRYSAVST